MNNVAGFGLLGLMAIVFVVWAVTAFRVLFDLKKIADVRRKAENAGLFRSQGITNEIFREFFTKPEHRKNRRRVVLLTALLFGIIILQMLLIPVLGPNV